MPTLRDATPESPAPVRALAMALGQWIDRLGTVWVEGQVAQLTRRPGLQTVFITLRDSVADVSVRVTAPRSLVDSLNPPLVDGASVVVHGKPSYWPTNGTLSLSVRDIRMVGLGELLARLERLRQLLAAEGLFDPRLKKDLPFLPRTVGLVTAPGSAAEQDVVENARRRWPAVRIATAHATVQGPRAAAEVIAALQRLDASEDVDVVVIARGGGSFEDLLPFSDEGLLRAVHGARTPVVSAIGHDQDSPLLDLVADVRASTPTDAAKMVVPDVAEEAAGVAWARGRARQVITALVHREQQGLADLRGRPVLADPRTLVDSRSAEVADLLGRSRRLLGHRLDRAADEIDLQRARVRALSPLATLQRGYAVLQAPDGQVVTSITALAPGDPLMVRVADGRVHATTTETEQLTGEDDE